MGSQIMSDFIFLPKVHPEIAAECDVTRLVSNRRGSTAPLLEYKVAVYSQPLDSCLWELLDVAEFGPSLAIKLSTADYPLEVGQLLVGVPIPLNETPPTERPDLPAPISRRRDDAPVAERAAIRFVYRRARSSYQGDYPYGMSRREHGSLFSMGALLACQSAQSKTFATMVNVVSTPLSGKAPCTFTMRDCNGRAVIASASFVRNSVAILEISGTFQALAKEVYFGSDDVIGIPIFISIRADGEASTISVEHSHPPHEYFWKYAQEQGGKRVKSAWMEKVKIDA